MSYDAGIAQQIVNIEKQIARLEFERNFEERLTQERIQTITLFSIFSAFIAFITSEIQIFKQFTDPLILTGLTFIFLTGIIAFVLLIELVRKPNKTLIAILVIPLVAAIFCFWLSDSIVIKQHNNDMQKINIHAVIENKPSQPPVIEATQKK
jgi:amino acid transporter